MASAHRQAESQAGPPGSSAEAGVSRGASHAEPSAWQSVPLQRPLRRYPDRGLLGGVCAGLADHFGVAVIVVRVLTAMFVAAGGIGVAIYAIAWALIPVAPESEGL